MIAIHNLQYGYHWKIQHSTWSDSSDTWLYKIRHFLSLTKRNILWLFEWENVIDLLEHTWMFPDVWSLVRSNNKSVMDIDKKLIEEWMIKTLTPPPHLLLWSDSNFWHWYLTNTNMWKWGYYVIIKIHRH